MIEIQDGWVVFDQADCRKFNPKKKGDQFRSVGNGNWVSYTSDYLSHDPFTHNFQYDSKGSTHRRPLANLTSAQLDIVEAAVGGGQKEFENHFIN